MFLYNMVQKLRKEEPESSQEEDREFLDEIHKAWDEWRLSQTYFENVSDPELVDYAVYGMEAARRKYMYMLKQAREKGLKEDRFVI